jgi:hypothetical protein
MPDLKKFVFATDLHWGYERDQARHKTALHDEKAINVMMEFASDFKPDYFILGGDALDCGAISHHNKHKPGNIEGLRLLSDAAELKAKVIKPAEKFSKHQTFIVGNHCDWLNDLITEIPALDGIINVEALLALDNWKVVPHGQAHKLGKLTFIHGDQIRGGEHIAKAAVTAYERNVRFGHHHTFQVHTKTSAVDANGHTGVAIPCLCKKAPRYGEGAPNRWMQGFEWGYVGGPDGCFNDYISVIVNGKSLINGKLYKG